MKIGFLQFKPQFGNVEQNIVKIEKLLVGKSFDLLVLPELSNSGYLFTSHNEVESFSEGVGEGKFSRMLQKIAFEKNSYIVSGFCEKYKRGRTTKYFNSALLVSPEGDFFVYRKIHLFAEESKWFLPGNIPFTVHTIKGSFGEVRIGIMICFDWIFPEAARSLTLKGAQIICHPSNLVMPYCQKAMFARSVENRVFIITANRVGSEIRKNKKLNFTGNSVIVDPEGNYLAIGSKSKEEVCIVEINPEMALSKKVDSGNDIFKERRTRFYFLKRIL